MHKENFMLVTKAIANCELMKRLQAERRLLDLVCTYPDHRVCKTQYTRN